MMIPSILLVLVVTSGIVKASTSGKLYNLYCNVNLATVNLPGFTGQRTVENLENCAMQCLAQYNCTAALYDGLNHNCTTFNEKLPVTLSVEKVQGSGITLIEISCPNTNTTITQEDCCSSKTMCYYGPRRDSVTFYRDCQDAFEHGERESGAYNLRLEGTTETKAWCDFDEVQGWTVIQKRIDGSVDFFRVWDDYERGFGFLHGEYWIGLKTLHHLTTTNQKLNIYLEAHDEKSRTANYSSFIIEDATTNYTAQASGYSGDAGDSLIGGALGINNRMFTTKDRDNDLRGGQNCAILYTGAWWYNSCHDANLNGVYYQDGISHNYAAGVVWVHWKGLGYSYKTIIMRVGRL